MPKGQQRGGGGGRSGMTLGQAAGGRGPAARPPAQPKQPPGWAPRLGLGLGLGRLRLVVIVLVVDDLDCSIDSLATSCGSLMAAPPTDQVGSGSACE